MPAKSTQRSATGHMGTTRPTRRVRDVPIGGLFFDGGRLWKVVAEEQGYVEARCEQTSARRLYYDPLTAAKAGEFSYERVVDLHG